MASATTIVKETPVLKVYVPTRITIAKLQVSRHIKERSLRLSSDSQQTLSFLRWTQEMANIAHAPYVIYVQGYPLAKVWLEFTNWRRGCRWQHHHLLWERMQHCFWILFVVGLDGGNSSVGMWGIRFSSFSSFGQIWTVHHHVVASNDQLAAWPLVPKQCRLMIFT